MDRRRVVGCCSASIEAARGSDERNMSAGDIPDFVVGDEVEVKGSDVFRAAWYEATVASAASRGRHYYVVYTALTGDQTSPLTEFVSVTRLRPRPPRDGGVGGADLQIRQFVEAFHRQGWWTAVVSSVREDRCSILIPSTGELVEVAAAEVRQRLRWIAGEWIPYEIQSPPEKERSKKPVTGSETRSSGGRQRKSTIEHGMASSSSNGDVDGGASENNFDSHDNSHGSGCLLRSSTAAKRLKSGEMAGYQEPQVHLNLNAVTSDILDTDLPETPTPSVEFSSSKCEASGKLPESLETTCSPAVIQISNNKNGGNSTNSCFDITVEAGEDATLRDYMNQKTNNNSGKLLQEHWPNPVCSVEKQTFLFTSTDDVDGCGGSSAMETSPTSSARNGVRVLSADKLPYVTPMLEEGFKSSKNMDIGFQVESMMDQSANKESCGGEQSPKRCTDSSTNKTPAVAVASEDRSSSKVGGDLLPVHGEVPTPSPSNNVRIQAEAPEIDCLRMLSPTTQKLPFIKSSQVWQTLESMEVLCTMPQKPHFGPLKKYSEEFREGMAAGLMVTFSNLACNIGKLRLSDPVEKFQRILDAFPSLEAHGFDVHCLRSRVESLMEIRSCYDRTKAEKAGLEQRMVDQKAERGSLDAMLVNLEKDTEKAEGLLRRLQEAKSGLLQEVESAGLDIARKQEELKAAEEASLLVEQRFNSLLGASW